MKILAFVDMHGSKPALKKLLRKAETENPDIIICAGDFTIFERNMTPILLELDLIGKPVLIIHGNHEDPCTLKESISMFNNIFELHEKHHIFGDAVFIGYGGGGFSVIDPDFERQQKNFEAMLKKGTKTIIVTHAPPYGTVLDLIQNQHCGNKTISEFIRKVQPDLLITGHLHENGGKRDMMGKTIVANPGPEGMIFEI